MIKSYFVLTLRRLKKDRFFAFLNITGLTIGVVCFILLALYVQNELSIDQFHSKSDRIYVIGENVRSVNGPEKSARYRTSYAARLKDRIPELEQMAMVHQEGDEILVKSGQEGFYERNVFWGNNELFEIFDFPIIEGKANLDALDKAVITESMAQKYFGDANPIGQLLDVDGFGKYEITAVAKDIPKNSSIQFNIVLSNVKSVKEAELAFDLQGGSIVTAFVLMPENTELEAVNEKVATLMLNEWPEHSVKKDENGELIQSMYFFPFKDMYLRSRFSWTQFPVSDIRYVYLFSSIALLILVIACLNYINLVTARSIQKSKEIGLRKVFGADRKQIFRQNMFESFLYTFLSVMIAFAIAERLLPYYNNLIEKELSLSYLSLEFLVFVFGLSSIVGFASGVYPALRLSSFKPIASLHGASKAKEKSGVRRGLVFFQFLVAQALIIATVIIQSQLSYLQNTDLGYNRENILFIPTYKELGEKAKVFKDEVAKISGVKTLSLSDEIIDASGIVFGTLKEIGGNEEASDEEYLISYYFNVDADFLKTMGMRVASGQSIDEIAKINSKDKIIVSKATVEKLDLKDPIGRRINLLGGEREIVAVIDDFHNETLKNELMPVVFVINDKASGYLSVRFESGQTREALSSIEDLWYSMVDDRPFKFRFYDDYYDANYRSETRLGKTFNVFSGIAIAISIFGLVGLSAFAAEQRLKEFGIRKVLGASVKQLIALMSKEFVLLIICSFLVACPIAYFGSNDWLDSFKYRIQVTPFTFTIGLLVTLVIAILSVSYQSLKVAKGNPAEILRNE